MKPPSQLVITAVKAQVSNPDRASIFINGRYKLALSLNSLAETKLKPGQILSRAELQQLEVLAIDDKAFLKSLNLLSRRPRSELELRQYLTRRDYPPATITKTLERLAKLSYVNDAEFARQWVANRRNFRQASSLKIRFELRQKGINSQLIDDALGNTGDNDELAIQRLIDKKLRSSVQPSYQKMMAFLLRRGYHYSTVKQALKDLNLPRT